MKLARKIILGLRTFPNTLLGLLFISLAIKGTMKIIDGALEIESPSIEKLFHHLADSKKPIIALTLGHVVIGCNKQALIESRRHERMHVTQYERWGIFFIPAFFIASSWAKLCGRHPYTDNIFEKKANAE